MWASIWFVIGAAVLGGAIGAAGVWTSGFFTNRRACRWIGVTVSVVATSATIGAAVAVDRENQAAAEVAEQRYRETAQALADADRNADAREKETRKTCGQYTDAIVTLVQAARSNNCPQALDVAISLMSGPARTVAEKARKQAECEALGERADGGASIRVAAFYDLDATKDYRGRLLTRLKSTKNIPWTPYVSNPTPGHWNGRPVHLIAITSVLPASEAHICEWVKCQGLGNGVADCAIRDR